MTRHSNAQHRRHAALQPRIVILPPDRRGGDAAPPGAPAGPPVDPPDATQPRPTQPTRPDTSQAALPPTSRPNQAPTSLPPAGGTSFRSRPSPTSSDSSTSSPDSTLSEPTDASRTSPDSSVNAPTSRSLTSSSVDTSDTSLPAGEKPASAGNSATIAGVVAAIVLVLIFLSVGAFYWWRRRQKNKRGFSFQDRQHSSFVVDNVSEKSNDDFKPGQSGQTGFERGHQRSDSDKSFLPYQAPQSQAQGQSQWSAAPAHHYAPDETPPVDAHNARFAPQSASTQSGDDYRPMRDLGAGGAAHQSNYFAPRPHNQAAQDQIEPLKLVDRGSKGFFKSNNAPQQQQQQSKGSLFPPVHDSAYGPELRGLMQDPAIGGLTLAEAWSRPTNTPPQGQPPSHQGKGAALPLPPKGASSNQASPLTFMDNWSKPQGPAAPKSEATLSFLDEWAQPRQPDPAHTSQSSMNHPMNLQAGPRGTQGSSAFSRHLAEQADYFKRGSLGGSSLADQEPEVLNLGPRTPSSLSQVRIGERQFIPSMTAPPVPDLPRGSVLDQMNPQQMHPSQRGPVGILKNSASRPAVSRESESPQTVMNFISEYSNTNAASASPYQQSTPGSNLSPPKKGRR